VDLPSIESLAQEHHGLVTRAGAKRRGVSRSAWYRGLAAGVIEAVHPGVARLVGTADTPEQRVAAAVLAAGKGAMASHRSAARLWGVPRPDDDPIDVMLADRRREATLVGVVVHRPRDRKDLSPVLRSGIRTSNVLRMLCDLGAVDPATASAAVGHVVTSGLASPAALRKAVDVHARRGRHGVPAFREALDEWVIDGKPVDSVLEKAMRRLREAFHLPPMEFHAVICGHEVDFWIVGSPIVLECDGWDSHGRNPVQFERDRVRDAHLTTEGVITVRFTHRQLTRRQAQTADRIRAVVQRWAPQLLAPTR
jgi:very-short-patch-repair endonuclease